MPLADAGMAMVCVKDTLAAIEQFSMRAVQTDTVIKAAVVAVHHVSKQISFVFGFLARSNLSWWVGHLCLA